MDQIAQAVEAEKNRLEGKESAPTMDDSLLHPKASTYGHFYQDRPFFNQGTLEDFNALQQQRLTLDKYKEFVVALHSPAYLAASDDTRPQNVAARRFWEYDAPKGFSEKLIRVYPSLSTIHASEVNPLADMSKSIAETPMFEMVPRAFLEENLSYVQLVSVVVLTDESKSRFIMLKTTSNTAMDDRLTFVQGHVAYDNSIYTTPTPTFLFNNALKELHEELKLTDSAQEILANYTKANGGVRHSDFYLLHSKEDLISYEHMGLIHVMNLGDDFDTFAQNIQSNEPDNHSVEVIEGRKELKADRLDAWSRIILTKISNK